MPLWVWLGTVAGALAVILAGRRGMREPLVAAPIPSIGIKRTAQAIARAEGFYVAGSVPQRAHNPGNLKLPGYPTIGPGISVFSSDDEGWSKLYRQLELIRDRRSAHYTPETTIAQMGQKWTATVHEQSAWSANVAGALGVPVSTKLGAVLA